MKLTTSLFNLAIAAIAAGALVSCTNEFSDMNPGKDGLSSIKLVKTPEVYAWSGQQTLQNTIPAPSDVITRGTDMNANMWDQKWDCPPRPAEDLNADELAELKALLSKDKETHNDVILPFENYYVQQIFKGTDTYHSVDHCAREAYDGSGVIKCNGNNYCDHLTSGDHTNNDNILGSNHMDKLVAYDGNENTTQWDATLGKNVPYPYGHVNNFNNGTNENYPDECGCGEQHYKTTLMTDMPTTGFGPDEQFGFHETFGTSHDYFNYIIVEYKGYYYVGFDYEAHKYDQDTHNHGEALDIERDWNFTDWIVRITPAYPKGTTPEGNPGGVTNPTPGNPGTETPDKCNKCDHPNHGEEICDECEEGTTCHPKNCDKCGHPSHGEEICDECEPSEKCHPAVCDKCGHGVIWDDLQGKFIHVVTSQNKAGNCGQCENDGNTTCTDEGIVALDDDGNEIEDKTSQGTTPPSKPSTPDKTYKHNNEVEVNLEIVDSHEDKGIKDLATKLSIHVRCATDVEIILPVPAKYTIDSDDLYILQNHYIDGKNGVYGGSDLEGDGVVLTYEIANTTVELHVQVLADCIKVWTVGINQDVIDYCMLHNGDGINFEVWTYYALENGDLTRTNLKNLLDTSTIKFNGPKDPTYYINAFGYDYEGLNKADGINPDDCTVKPVENSGYNLEYTNATHLNGTPYNDIYVKDDKTADATHSNGSKPTPPSVY